MQVRNISATESKAGAGTSRRGTAASVLGIGKGSGYPLPYKRGAHSKASSASPEKKAVKSHAPLSKEPVHTREHEHENDSHAPTKESIKIYFGSIKQYKLLNHEEEISLAGRIAKGDTEARDAMISSNLRLVVNIARRYLNRGLSFDDLIEEGNLGLIKAVERFKATKGCRFSTYATFWIKQTIERALANQSNTVRLPIHISTDLYKVAKASKELLATLHREPDLAEISQRTGFSGRYVKKLDTISKKSLSLESLTHENSDHTLLDRLEDDRFLTPEASLEDSDRTEKIKALMKTLDESERKILQLRFGFDYEEPHTLEAIGNAFGVTRERVRQIESKALGKLRELARRSDITSMEMI